MQKHYRRGFTQQHFEGHYVYLLKSLNFDEYYIGSTNDLEKRLAEHNEGKSFHTKKYSPWKLEYYEAYKSEELAREREKALKKHGNAKRGLKMRAGVSGTVAIKKKNAAGFTLVEMMVVMAIIAVLALIGISAIININSSNAVDRASEEVLGAIRESQNKAISIASNPIEGLEPPIAWGVYIDSTGKKVQTFYINSNKEFKISSEFDYPILEKITLTGMKYHFFTTPFGKYYASDTQPENWSANTQRPYDSVPSGVLIPREATIIKFEFRNNNRQIGVETSGDVNAQ